MINLILLVKFMNTIKVILLALTMVFLFATPNDSFASKHRQQIITNQITNNIIKINFGYIVAHKGEETHRHPHNIMMGKKIKKEKKKDKTEMRRGAKRVRSLRSESKQRNHHSKKIRKHD